MGQPDQGAEEVARIKAIQDNAKRLGLVWQRTVGTVTAVNPPTVLVDADTVPIGMVSMVGDLYLGQRVYVDQVPPSANFISGIVAANPYRARQTLIAAQSSVVLTDIPANLRSLTLRWSARCDNAVNVQAISLRVNASAAAVYSTENLQANNATVTCAATAGGTSAVAGVATGASAPASVFGSGVVQFSAWDSPVGQGLGFTHESQALGTGVANFFHFAGGGIYAAAGPYRTLTIIPAAGNFIIGSDFQLEGVPF